MADSVTTAMYNKLVSVVKKNPGESESFYVEATGIPKSQMLANLVKAEVEADPTLKIKFTGAQVVNARDKDGLRWPRIAARTGHSVTEVKALYEEHSGKSAAEAYTGRGRNFAGGGGSKTKTSGGAGRKSGGTGRGTSGRRAAAKKTAAAPPAGRRRGKTAAAGRGKSKTAGRARTRADRTAKSGDPQ